ncbi:hypothetical protein HNO88_000928 [Novosphingobium chloroacetimidivorans]|uniref:Uncharacterized protein n=1 Tax=Novosphingobium chloroacetimidivorans TaxID=1428314 RepID=A0A7W7NVY5_9SPHN|nr:hypothetical protein [Novosphingobium chloroacetimidivorans]MBB4857617.1 hypothetical protein [Novosphingobium chloroacetimidivorans]
MIESLVGFPVAARQPADSSPAMAAIAHIADPIPLSRRPFGRVLVEKAQKSLQHHEHDPFRRTAAFDFEKLEFWSQRRAPRYVVYYGKLFIYLRIAVCNADAWLIAKCCGRVALTARKRDG